MSAASQKKGEGINIRNEHRHFKSTPLKYLFEKTFGKLWTRKLFQYIFFIALFALLGQILIAFEVMNLNEVFLFALI